MTLAPDVMRTGRCTVTEVGTAEAVDSGKGIWLVKIIAADVRGTNGFYPGEVLSRDIARAFPSGTHYYIDHPTQAQEGEPRSLRDLAGVQLEDAYYLSDGPQGKGGYARVQLLPNHRGTVEATAPHAGVSINALAVREFDSGMNDYVVTELIQGMSVDFVSRAGAGGKLVAMTESAREGSANQGVPMTTPQQAPQPGIFQLSEADRTGLQKLYEAVQSVSQRIEKIEEKAAAPAKNDAGEGSKTLSPADVIAKLDETKLSKLSRQRVAMAAVEPDADLDKLIKDATELEVELSKSLGTTGSHDGAGNDASQQNQGGQPAETVDVTASQTPATESARGQVTQEAANATGWASRIDAMFGGGL